MAGQSGSPRRFGASLTPLVGVLLVVGAVAVFWVRFADPSDGGQSVPTSTSTTVLSGPTTSTSTTSTTLPSVPTGGTVTMAVVGEPVTLNPLLEGGSGPAVDLVSDLWTTGLFSLAGESLDPVPELAVAIPSTENGGLKVNKDGTMIVRIELDSAAKWSDGTPITGDDLKFTHSLVMDRRLPIRSDLRELHDLIVPGSMIADPSSIVFVMERPSIRFLGLFPTVVPKAQVDGSNFAVDWSKLPWLSGGPFMLEDWTPGEQMVFVQNPNYWRTDDNGQRLPYLDRIEVGFAGVDENLVSAFRLREYEIVPIEASPVLVNDLRETTGVDVAVDSGAEWEHVAFQFGSGRLETNPASMNESIAFRELLARVFDRSVLLDEMFGGFVEPLNTVTGMSWPGASSDGWAQYAPNPQDIAGLLDQIEADLDVSFEEVRPLVRFSTSSSPQRTQIAGSVLQALGAAGITVDVELLDLGEFFRDRVISGEFDVAEWAWRATPGPLGAVQDLEERLLINPDDGGFGFSRWIGSVDEEDQLRQDLEGLDLIIDLDELQEALQRIDSRLADEMILLPIAAELQARAVRTGLVGGFDYVGLLPDTWNAAYWFRVDR